jgi:hypothetical protein
MLALFLVTGEAKANLIANGSFESPVIPANSFEVLTSPPTSWSLSGFNGFMFNGNYPGWPLPEDGNQYIDMGGEGYSYNLYQTFTVTTSGQYQLTWYDNAALGDGHSYEVSITDNAGNVVAQTGVITNTGNAVWHSQILSVALSPGLYTLNFASGPGLDTLIDNVSLVSVNPLVGSSVEVASNNEFSLNQNAQGTGSVQLVNPGNTSHSATLSVVSPYPGLSVSLTQPNPVAVDPGQTVGVPLAINAGTMAVGVYDGILLKVAVDDGSIVYADIKVCIQPTGAAQLPDLAISSQDISSATNADGSVTLTAVVHNQGAAPASNVAVQFNEFNNVVGNTVIAQVAAGAVAITSITVPGTPSGNELIRVVVDPAGAIQELTKTNNEASQVIQFGGTPGLIEGDILVTGNLPSTVVAGSPFTISGNAVYAISVNGVTNTSYVVKGASVQVTVTAQNGGGQWVYGNIYTDVNGNFTQSLEAPASPGLYTVAMTVTDNTFIGTRDLVFSVVAAPQPPPPFPCVSSNCFGGPGGGSWSCIGSSCVWTWTYPPDFPPGETVFQSDVSVFSKDIYFSDNNPAVNETITIFAAINYWASSTADPAQSVPVSIYVTSPGSPPVLVGHTVIGTIPVGSSPYYVYADWQNQAQGIYIVQAQIDPSYVEANMLNNAATRAIIVGQTANGLGAISGQVADSVDGVGSVVIEVLDANGNQLASTLTDQTGFYLITDLPPGTLQVQITPPAGYVADAVTKAATVSAQLLGTVDFQLTWQAPSVVPSNEIATTASGLAYSRVSKTFNGTVTIKNVGSSTVSGPFEILFTGIPASVTLVNATGNLSGTPYLTVPSVASLAPGQSATVSVKFSNPSNATINVTPVIYSGGID